MTQRATVIYDFEPQEEDEVAVTKGQQVEVVYEVGGWLQVGGARERGSPVLCISLCALRASVVYACVSMCA